MALHRPVEAAPVCGKFSANGIVVGMYEIRSANKPSNSRNDSQLLGGGPKPPIVPLKPRDGGDILHSHLH